MTQPARPLEAIVLDFDGLVLDTELVEYRSLQELYQSHGTSLSFEEWRSTVGSVGTDWLALLEHRSGQRIHAEANAALLDRQRELVAAQPLLPGVGELIDQATTHGVPVGIASSGRADRVHPELRHRGLDTRLGAVITIDDVARAKPDPEPYLRAVEKLGARPERSVAFEDSSYGMAAALAAGLRCVAVPSDITRAQDFTAATLVVNRVDDIDVEALLRGEVRGYRSRSRR